MLAGSQHRSILRGSRTHSARHGATSTLCQFVLMVAVPNDATALPILKKLSELSFRVTIPTTVEERRAIGAEMLESMLEVLPDPLYPAAVDVVLADGTHGQVAGGWIGHETGLDPVILQGAKQLVGLSDRNPGVPGVGQ